MALFSSRGVSDVVGGFHFVYYVLAQSEEIQSESVVGFSVQLLGGEP